MKQRTIRGWMRFEVFIGLCLAGLIMWLLIFAVAALISGRAHAAASCDTEKQARAKHPEAHLYWHGRDHCWDASPKRPPTITRHVPSLLDDAPTLDPNGNGIERHAATLLDVTWYATAFKESEPLTPPLFEYAPQIKPDENSASLIVYAEDEFNELDAQAAALPATTAEVSHFEHFAKRAPLVLALVVMMTAVGLFLGARKKGELKWPTATT